MIHKKGDPSLPANYRGIALVNCMTKLCTSLICNRLTAWAEAECKLPETQAGFRNGRGCLGQIFSLTAIVHIKLRKILKKHGKLYALFIDIKRAFDSISHTKLWRKLHGLGVSSRVINTLRSLYDNAKICVRTQQGNTKFYSITQGVLQEEILSPLLFALFISDIDKFLDNKGCTPVSLGGNNALHLLMLADDNVTLSESRAGLQFKINCLKEYFAINDLEINLGKTKVILFRRGGKSQRKIGSTLEVNPSLL